MLTVHLLGHAHVTQNGQPVPLSAKAVALIAYLAAERLPQHRERLADLLWNTAEARTNLRVELARIRSAGLNIFPASRQLLYLESISTDIDQWEALQEHEMNQTELSTWLATLRGLPLCGLEDLGSTAFQVWVEQQRWMLCEKVEGVLARVYAHYVRSGQDWATRLISSRAEAVGFTDPAEFLTEALINEAVPLQRLPQAAITLTPPSPLFQGNLAGVGRVMAQGSLAVSQVGTGMPGGRLSVQETTKPSVRVSSTRGTASKVSDPVLHFARPHEERQLQDLLLSAQPQVMLLAGPPGSGKTYLAERLASQVGPSWEVLRLTAARSGRLLLAALAQALLKLAEPDQVQTLRQVLLQPGALEEDMVKVAVTLSHIGQPLLLVLDEVHAAPSELTGLLELICQMSNDHARLVLLLCRESPDRQQVTRGLLRRLPATQTLELAPVSLTSVQQVLMARYPDEASARIHPLASRLAQRSEGNPLHLLSLLNTLPEADALSQLDLGALDLGGAALPQEVRDTLRSEPESWNDTLRDALSRLSVINGAFDRLAAQAALNLGGADVDALLCDALEAHVLLEVDPGLGLQMPDLLPIRTSPETDVRYMFRNEALRVTLAGQLPQLIRQDVRCRLARMLAPHQPGLASYYAERAGLHQEATQLLTEYQARLPQDSPLRAKEREADLVSTQMVLTDEPARLFEQVRRTAHQQGYGISLEGGWLSVMSDGRYGHPQTLTIRLQWPEPLDGDLRLIWRLDVFGGGEELRPVEAPFPLRLIPLRAGVSLAGHTQSVPLASAFVFTPRCGGEYREAQRLYKPQEGVRLAQWMEHRLGGPEWQGATGVEISVRALDVALTIGYIGPERYTAFEGSPVRGMKTKAGMTSQTR